MRRIALLLLACAAFLVPAISAAAQQPDDIDVNVQISGDEVIVDLSLLVPATRQETWAVLTDFAHMSGFVSNLKESRVTASAGDTLEIFQRGSAAYGPISFPFESTRAIRLTPQEMIQSHLLSGSMRKMEGTTRLTEEGTQTRIVYHADTVPGVWIPPLLGKTFIEHEAREQFNEMRHEIMRRQHPPISLAPS